MRRAKSRRGPCEPVLRGNLLKPGVQGGLFWTGPRGLCGSSSDSRLTSALLQMWGLGRPGRRRGLRVSREGSRRFNKTQSRIQSRATLQVPSTPRGVSLREIGDSGPRVGPRRGTDFSRVVGGSRSPVGQEGWRMLLSRRRQRRTGRPARTPRRALAGRLEARSAPAPSLFFPNKFLTQIGDWIRLSLACWHCLEKNLVSGRKCKRSKGELVELSWNVTFVAGQRVAPRSTTALDSPEEPLVLLPREPCWGTSSLRHES